MYWKLQCKKKLNLKLFNMYPNSSSRHSGSGKIFTGPDLTITGTNSDLRELIQKIHSKTGIPPENSPSSWNESRFSENKSSFILYHSHSNQSTVFTNSDLMSETRVRYNGDNLKEVLKLVKKHVDRAAHISIPDEDETLEVGGHKIKILSKDMTEIAGYKFPKEFWLASKIVSEHVKAKIKIGCMHQYDLELTTIEKTIQLLSSFKKRK